MADVSQSVGRLMLVKNDQASLAVSRVCEQKLS